MQPIPHQGGRGFVQSEEEANEPEIVHEQSWQHEPEKSDETDRGEKVEPAPNEPAPNELAPNQRPPDQRPPTGRSPNGGQAPHHPRRRERANELHRHDDRPLGALHHHLPALVGDHVSQDNDIPGPHGDNHLEERAGEDPRDRVDRGDIGRVSSAPLPEAAPGQT